MHFPEASACCLLSLIEHVIQMFALVSFGVESENEGDKACSFCVNKLERSRLRVGYCSVPSQVAASYTVSADPSAILELYFRIQSA